MTMQSELPISICAHPQGRIETVTENHLYCNKCCGHFYLAPNPTQIERTLYLKYEKLNGIIKEIQNIIDTNCLGETNGN